MKILLVGCGKIGLPLLKGWIMLGVDNLEIVVIQPSMRHSGDFGEYENIRFFSDLKEVPQGFVEDLIVLAVKPQSINDVVPHLISRDKKAVVPHLISRDKKAVVVSTLAGIKLEDLKKLLPHHKEVIRLMPNLAIRTGHSVNMAFQLDSSKYAVELFHQAFEDFGEIVFLEREEQIDALTPIFGSGIAYFFLLAKLLFEETLRVGIDMDIAKKCVDELIIGSATLIDSEESYNDIIDSVSSKKGVTEVALKAMNPDMAKAIGAGILAALERLKELSHDQISK